MDNESDAKRCKLDAERAEPETFELENEDSIEEINQEGINEIDEQAKQTFIADLSAICGIERTEAEVLLKDHNWNMQAAIDNFLDKSREDDVMVIEQEDDTGLSSSSSNAACPRVAFASETCPEIVELEEGDGKESDELNRDREMSSDIETNSGDSSVSSSPSHSARFSTWAPEKFSIISWNLDGLDDKNLEKRTEAVLGQIIRENHAVIFFQELIPQTFDYLATNLVSTYVPVLGTEDPTAQYLTATFLRRNHVIYESHEILPYPNTTMGRNLLVTKAFIGRAKLCFLNTHLESTAEFAAERQNQLQFCFRTCSSLGSEYNVIFGGDLNLRDKEVSNVPQNMCDLWVKCGARESCKYTWDLTRNTNKQMPSKYQPRLRFDRLFFRSSDPQTLTAEFFGVTGIEKVPGTQSFPSDHWAIICFFKVANEARKPLPKKRKAENSPGREFR